MIESHFEGAVDGDGAAEAHAAEHREFAAAFEQQADDLEEVLVPADGDSVFGDTAEARHDAVIQRFVDLADIANGGEAFALTECVHAGKFLGKRLDLEAIHADYGVAIVHQIVRERESGGAESDD